MPSHPKAFQLVRSAMEDYKVVDPRDAYCLAANNFFIIVAARNYKKMIEEIFLCQGVLYS